MDRNDTDIMNVGGFNDTVFDAIGIFAKGEVREWVEIARKIAL